MAVNTGKIQGKHMEFNLNLNVATLACRKTFSCYSICLHLITLLTCHPGLYEGSQSGEVSTLCEGFGKNWGYGYPIRLKQFHFKLHRLHDYNSFFYNINAFI